MTRNQSYQFFLEEQDRARRIFKTIVEASLEELAVFSTSSDEEERWLAQWQLNLRSNNKHI